MEAGRITPASSKTRNTPRGTHEKATERQVLKIMGKYGLRNKREFWRAQSNLDKIHNIARELLNEEKGLKRLSEGNALMHRLVRHGVLDEGRMNLEHVLDLKVEDFLERRLQTQVFRLGMALSIQHACDLIRQKHIRVHKRVVNIPSFMVHLDSQAHIDFSMNEEPAQGNEGAVEEGEN